MNRSVLARQMFAAGGAAFPDLSGDGKITRKDILMGRGVPMQMGGEPQMALGDYLGGQTDELAAEAARLGISKEQLLELLNQQAMQQPQAQPVGMAMGGDPAMAQGVGGMMPPDMPPPPAMPEGQGMAEQVMDPQVLEGLLGQAQENLGNIDEAEDYETVINSIRGDDAPISARYEELASVVGEEDAAQTPESVLALTQPAIMMGGVDEGIGGLAQAEMTQPVEGAMAQGIMSTVAPPPPAAPPMDPAMMGGPPPVNFNQGGLVRRGDNQPVQMYENGGEATPLQTAYEGRLPLYKSIVGDPTAQLEEQKNLTQAQMLFDIAGTALAFAAPMQGETAGMSAAERLAMAAQQTKLLPTIGARAQQQLDAKKAATAAEQKMKLGALGAAEADVTAQAKAAAAERKDALSAGYRINEIMLEQTGKSELAQDQANWKAALQDDQQLAAEAIERLKGDNSKEAIRLREGLQNQNAIRLKLLAGEQALEQIGLQGMNAIAKQDKAHIQALTIQENNQALSREQKRIDVGLKTIDQQIAMDGNDLKKAAMLQQANAETRRFRLDEEKLALEKQGLQNTAQYRANQLAIAYADQDIKEAQMLQNADATTQQQRLKQRELELKERKILIGEAAAGLKKFGSGTQAMITTFLSDEKRIKAYKEGTMGKDETLEMNTILTLYANPIDVWNEEKQDWVTQKATPLSNEVMDALKTRKEKDLTMPAGITIPGLTEDDDGAENEKKPKTGTAGDDLPLTTFESLIEGLDAAKGTGAPAAFGEAINTSFKAVLPFLNKPFSEGSRAARLINNINTQATIVYMTDVSGKVNLQMQERILETLPKPSQWFSTDQDAINAIENTIAAFNGRLQAIDVQLKPADKGGVGGLGAEEKSRLSSQRESLKVIRDAYAALGKDYINSGSKKKNKKPITDYIG